MSLSSIRLDSRGLRPPLSNYSIGYIMINAGMASILVIGNNPEDQLAQGSHAHYIEAMVILSVAIGACKYGASQRFSCLSRWIVENAALFNLGLLIGLFLQSLERLRLCGCVSNCAEINACIVTSFVAGYHEMNQNLGGLNDSPGFGPIMAMQAGHGGWPSQSATEGLSAHLELMDDMWLSLNHDSLLGDIQPSLCGSVIQCAKNTDCMVTNLVL